jgi:hypothetical protein
MGLHDDHIASLAAFREVPAGRGGERRSGGERRNDFEDVATEGDWFVLAGVSWRGERVRYGRRART